MSYPDNAGRSAPSVPAAPLRTAWIAPRVIVSDLGDARAQTITPGGDGSTPSYGPYGS
jgi:hypothetical protein